MRRRHGRAAADRHREGVDRERVQYRHPARSPQPVFTRSVSPATRCGARVPESLNPACAVRPKRTGRRRRQSVWRHDRLRRRACALQGSDPRWRPGCEWRHVLHRPRNREARAGCRGLNPPGGRSADDIVFSAQDGPSPFAHPLCANTYRNGRSSATRRRRAATELWQLYLPHRPHFPAPITRRTPGRGRADVCASPSRLEV